MKLASAAFALVGAGVAMVGKPPSAPVRWVTVIGHYDGYVSPCGCVKPMAGGMRQLAAAVRAGPADQVVLDSGTWVRDAGRQSFLKAEAFASMAQRLNVRAVALTPDLAAFPSGEQQALQELTRAEWLRPGETAELSGLRVALQEAADVVFWPGDREAARTWLQNQPGNVLLIFRSGGTPPAAEKVGRHWMASPGAQGRYYVRAQRVGTEWRSVERRVVTPGSAEDPIVTRMFRRYQRQVAGEGFLARLPRVQGPRYAGSDACLPCHTEVHRHWEGTAHATALTTLEKTGDDQDPECVSCHVTGLESDSGFRSRAETRAWASVGCESCHGPAAAHAADPETHRMAAIGADSCVPCHTPNHSPGFDFLTYWPKIAHPKP